MQCPLCGQTFDAQQMSCHSSCALNEHCGIICCPNCGYQMPDESKSKLAAGFRALLDRFAARSQHSDTRIADEAPIICSLSRLHAGECGRIVSVDSPSTSRLERLHVFGLIPGNRVTLEQQHPEFVLRVDHTELTVERDVANEILVEVMR